MFKVGYRVKWESGAGRGWTVKEGKIVAVVPAGAFPQDILFTKKSETPTGIWENYTVMFDCPSLPRNHESYLVEVFRFPGDQAKPRLYWPRVTQLRKI